MISHGSMQHAASDCLIFCSRVVKTVLSNSSFIILFNLKTPNGGAFAFGEGAGWVGVARSPFFNYNFGGSRVRLWRMQDAS